MSSNITSKFKKQLPRNMFFQGFSFLSKMAIGIWLVPYLVRNLGKAAYGLVPLAAVMTEYVNIISQSISGAVSRYLTIALNKNDYEEANRIFNTAFFSYLSITIIQIPVYIVIILNIQRIFSVPYELYYDAIILFSCSAIAFLINLATSVYVVPRYSYNRLDITRVIEIGTQFLRLIGIVFLFSKFGPSLRYIGYTDLTVRIIATIANVITGKMIAPTLHLNIKYFQWKKVKQLTTMGGWLIINYIGFLLFLKIDIWVCNRFISANAAGEYAAILPWSNYLRQGATLIAGVINPMILIYFAKGEMENLIRLNSLSVRIFSFLFAIPISILCVYSKSFLMLWLGKEYETLAPLMVLMALHLVINLGVIPLFGIQTALNKVRWPAVVTIIMGVINVCLSILFIKYLKWGIYGVAIASAIVLTLKNALFTPVYAASILKKPWYIFLQSYTKGILLFGILLIINLLIQRYFTPQTWEQLIGVSIVIGFAGICLLWIFLSRGDRRILVDLIPGRFQTLMVKLIEI